MAKIKVEKDGYTASSISWRCEIVGKCPTTPMWGYDVSPRA
jgi:hypothetical protein